MIWVAVGFLAVLGGRIPKMAAASIAVTVAGSLMIALSDYSAGGNHLWGDALALAAAMFSAVYTLIGRQVRRGMSTTVYTFIVYVFCALSLCGATFFSGQSLTGHGMSSVMVGLLLAVFSTLLKYFSPSFVSASKLCEPVAASLFAVLLFGEIPAGLQVAGGLVTVGGVLLYSRVESGEAGRRAAGKEAARA